VAIAGSEEVPFRLCPSGGRAFFGGFQDIHPGRGATPALFPDVDPHVPAETKSRALPSALFELSPSRRRPERRTP
jgi:hypothetical protein